ncbi:EamA family transporter RarD [Pseudoduganella sp. DS3]|uniref:EamA family transporter RarD n=1 Tax=Pseudoduganella guangdongensis TaxID=2692179 RepID=A0A6N9HDE9_9BURK|nr:EamA family transporter RarD [Pseudoduganella guangdongensis]
MKTGMLYAAGAFLAWGLFPLYFHAIKDVPASEILAHRMAWSLVFLMLVLLVRRQWKWLPQVLRQPKVVISFVASAFLLSANWFVYIWAVNNGHVVDASLGYFINPLVNVLLGMLVLKEKLRRGQWLAIAVAATGVAWLTWQGGQVPYIALVLALSFGAYGLLRKTAALAALEGLSFETLILFPLAVAYLGWLVFHGQSVFINAEADSTRWLLVAAGPTTAIPLLLFAAGARRIPMSVLGMLQYMSPSLQMLLGVWVFHEAFSANRLVGFLFIWGALAIYMLEGWLSSRKSSST